MTTVSYSEFALRESRDGFIYHAAPLEIALNIIASDVLKSSTFSEFKRDSNPAQRYHDVPTGVAFTRSANFAAHFVWFKHNWIGARGNAHPVIFELDLTRLTANYSVKPSGARMYGADQFEEYTDRDVTNLSRYVTRIIVPDDSTMRIIERRHKRLAHHPLLSREL